jgi:hypothetical protein
MSEEISWNSSRADTTPSGPHKEYPNNLRIAENFCAKVEKKMYPGMRTYVVGSPQLPKSLMYISWKPPKEHPMGTCATPIFLHDTTSNVNKRIEGIFTVYMRKAKEWFDKHPPQPDLPGLELTILGQKV